MRISLERELVCRGKQPANSPVSAAHYHGALGWRGQLTPLQGLFHPPLGEVKNLSRVEMPSKGCKDVSAVAVTCNMWGRLMYDDIYLIFTILIIHSNTPFIAVHISSAPLPDFWLPTTMSGENDSRCGRTRELITLRLIVLPPLTTTDSGGTIISLNRPRSQNS